MLRILGEVISFFALVQLKGMARMTGEMKRTPQKLDHKLHLCLKNSFASIRWYISHSRRVICWATTTGSRSANVRATALAREGEMRAVTMCDEGGLANEVLPLRRMPGQERGAKNA